MAQNNNLFTDSMESRRKKLKELESLEGSVGPFFPLGEEKAAKPEKTFVSNIANKKEKNYNENSGNKPIKTVLEIPEGWEEEMNSTSPYSLKFALLAYMMDQRDKRDGTNTDIISSNQYITKNK